MAGARPSSFKQGGGGSFNGVDGVISDYEFTTTHPFASEDKKANEDYIYAAISADLDGNDDTQVTALFVGSADDFTISKDGKTLTPVDDDNGLRVNSPFSKFVNSLVEKGFPESSLPEDAINFETIIGTRVRFVQVDDVDAAGNVKKRKVLKGKFKGREFPQTHTEIGAVYELPGKAGKGVKAAPKGKGKAVEPEVDEDDAVATLATESLLALLKKAKGNSILKKKLPVQIINQVGAKHPDREAVRKLVTSDEFLEAGEKWSYDSESQEITLD